MNNDPVVIIGSGLAGYMLAKEFRKLDTSTPLTIITASDGRFYSKPLLSTALTQGKTADALSPFDADAMSTQLNAEIRTDALVQSIDPDAQCIKVNDQAVSYSRLVLACGSRTIDAPLKGNAVSDIQSVNDLEAYGRFREWLHPKKRIALLGSGLVGCEFANDLRNGGYEVSIIAPDAYPLARLVPEAIGQVLQAALEKKGVTWHLGSLVTAVDHVSDSRYQVTLDDHAQLMADGVFSAIGLRAVSELAEQAGIQVNRGIVVDRELRTSREHIFALGDCAEVAGEVKQYVAPLLQCARTLAQVLAGNSQSVHYPTLPIVIKTPACPVVASPPPASVEGSWRYEGEGSNISALYYDAEDRLRGFALVGDKVKEKMQWVKECDAQAASTLPV